MTANEINALVDRLREQRNLSDAEFKTILETDAYDAALQKAADEVRRTVLPARQAAAGAQGETRSLMVAYRSDGDYFAPGRFYL